jgi:superoxide dismutase, Fe-Mn family
MHRHEQEQHDERTSDDSRRSLLKTTAAGLIGALATGAPAARAQDGATAGLRLSADSFSQMHEPRPLPFDPGNLDGLSERLIESHWSNNYGGSVSALNEIKRRLGDALSDPDLPAYVYNDLKREHLMRTGSVVLHELYFENLGGNGTADADVRRLIGSAFGDFDRWETEFRRVAGGLGGGSGWAVLAYNRHFGTLENYWMADHMHGPTETVPLLVIDMYEHSYHMDYGAAAARYVDAFFANINWETVLARVESLS